MPAALAGLPATITAGDTVRFTVSGWDDVVPPTYALTVMLRGAGTLDAVGVQVGAEWEVTLPATGTAALPAGTYQATARWVGSGNTFSRPIGAVAVHADPATQPAGDAVPWEERTLAVARHVLEHGVLPDGLTGYMVGDQQVHLMKPAELLDLIGRLEARVAQRRARGAFGVPVRFTPIRGTV